MVARWVSVSVVSFGQGSEEGQEAELVVELEHGFEPQGSELVVVCLFIVFMSRAARAVLIGPGPVV